MKNRENNIFWKGLVRVQRTLIIITATAVALVIAGACILRAFDINFIGFEEITIMVVFWLYMVGCAHGTYEKSQITADILEVMLPETAFKKILRLIRVILTFVLCVVLTYWGLSLAITTAGLDTRTPVFRIPVVIGQSSIFVGLLISSFYNFIYMLDEIKAFIKKTPRGNATPAIDEGKGEV